MAVTLSVSAINNQGNLGRAIDDTLSKESLKNIAISSLSAGLASGLSVGVSEGFGLNSVNDSSLGLSSSSSQRIADNLKVSFQDVAINGVSSSAVQSLIKGDSFSETLESQLENAVVMTLAKVGANEIGRLSHETVIVDKNGNVMDILDPKISQPTQLALHGVLGGVTAKLSGGDVASGAVSGVAGELTAQYLKDNTSLSDKDILRTTEVVSGVSSSLMLGLEGKNDDGDSVFVGSRIGRNAGENNYLLKTAEVEKGDTLNSISKEINEFFGTDLTPEELAKINNIEDLDKLLVGDKVKVGTIDPKTKEIWQMFYDNPERVNLKFWEDLKVPQQKIVHYGKRIFEDDDLPTNQISLQKELELKLWKRQSGDAIAHNIGTSGNIDYRGVGSRSHQQIIFDKNGNIVTSAENAGSYDYITPDQSYKGHNVIDVNPWIKYGNTPQDSSTEQQRLDALRSNFWGKVGNNIWGE